MFVDVNSVLLDLVVAVPNVRMCVVCIFKSEIMSDVVDVEASYLEKWVILRKVF